MTSPFATDGPLVGARPPSGFDFSAIGQRSATYTFTLIDISGMIDPTPLTPLKGSRPSISHDTTRTVKRTMSLALGTVDTARFDPVRHRVLVSMTVGGVTYPLGRYMAVDRTRAGSTGGDQASIAFTDELAQVATPIEIGFTVPQVGLNPLGMVGVNIGVMIRSLLGRFLLFDPRVSWGGVGASVLESGGYIPVEMDIEPTPYVSSAAWRAGTSGGQVLEDLAMAGDYWSPWMDNRGTFRMTRTFDPASPSTVPLSDWDVTRAVIRSSVSYTDDLLTAANRFVVISNRGSGVNATQAIRGSYDVPSEAPWSIANRGFVIADIRDVQVESVEAAQVAARNMGRRQQVYERAQVSTPPDPRHDSYNVIRWRGVPWLELAWTLPLTEGEPMVHTLRRAYTDA